MLENNGLADLFDDLMTGRKTVDQLKEELEGAKFYLRAGRNYRALKFDGFARVGGEAANVYVAGEKVNTSGARVESKPRAPKVPGKKRGA